MNHPKALLVSEDPSLMGAVREALSSTVGFELEVVASVDRASEEILGHDRVVVILVHLDGRMNVAGLARILQTIDESRRPVATIAVCEQANADQALVLARLGVAECLTRPLDLAHLAYRIDALTVEARYAYRRGRAPEPESPEVLSLGDDPPFLFIPTTRMGRLVDQIKRIAPLETSVMIGGETGTGKTRLAAVIHQLSPRRNEPFLTINCGALAANLIESEMFGHAKGAFTGADSERTGKFAAVGRGTLFLDEIDSLPAELQAKLLRVVEERAFEPVGSNKTMRLRARLIVASNRPLDREVAAGRFRADLYYRFNVVAFEVPPLRERRPLIPALARSLLAELAARDGRHITGISPWAMQALAAHSWPGNIRELRNVIERAVALCPGEVIELDDLPEHFHAAIPAAASVPASALPTRPTELPSPVGARGGMTSPTPATNLLPGPAANLLALDGVPPIRSSLIESKERAELSSIKQALERNNQNRLRAAAELGISRMTLYKKLRKYGLMGT